ncbi:MULTISPECIES: site-specific DNA-methyltransferase [Enterococcus]|uniref:site-specific DNA-methyltransferase n=1 Tax=Enterococcus TaxID=1350 RepID=UPI00289145D3|nr:MULTISPECIES: site-specific DNA-methyltransferase [Enterococcus]MDT2755738.1 site-specific DNA-methyltransferase [Enterococcus pseudoavium]MDV7787502.1 site-specific DNA-methyltransferase [Enterococcus gallinarum]
MKTLGTVNKSSKSIKDDLFLQLEKLIPEVFEEGKIDFEKMKNLLSDNIDNSIERYSFIWNGKNQSMKLAQQPTVATLKPNKEKSKGWDATQNLYIEGDNLEGLKLLQKSYADKVKLIYVDPPYNTGKDFVYKDNFSNSIDNYLEQTGQVDSEGNKLTVNTDMNGRYHTDWLNMMYPRLKLARNLLTDDGVIFISIDDAEQANLKKIADEIFGEKNFLAQVIWERAFSPINLKKNFSESHDYILVYGKDASKIVSNGLKRSQETNDRYSNADNDPRGPWTSGDLSVGPAIEKNIYPITTPGGREVMPPSGYSWRLSESTLKEYIEDNRIWFGEDGNNTPRIKRFLSEVKQTVVPMTVWKYEDVGHSQSASQYLKRLFDDKAYFSYPKPVPLIQRIVELYSNPDSIILDFFSGSATTAEAVMRMNAEDGGNRRFIMVQLPEQLSEKDVAFKNGYKTIPEIAEERIRRAGDKIVEENPLLADKLDIGFKVFELSKSNIKKWNAEPKDLNEQFELLANNFEESSKPIDVVYEIMLKQGLDLTYPISETKVGDAVVYDIAFGAMFVVLGDKVTSEVADHIIKQIADEEAENSVVVLQDEKFINDSEKLNTIEQLNASGIQYNDILSI